MRLGWTEVLVVLAVVLILFGSTRLPALGKSLGKSLRNFKRGVTGLDDDDEPTSDPVLAAKSEVAAPAVEPAKDIEPEA